MSDVAMVCEAWVEWLKMVLCRELVMTCGACPAALVSYDTTCR